MAAYVILTREKTTDEAELKTYGEMAGKSMKGHAGKALAFYGTQEILEGSPHEGAVILEFPTIEEAKAWYDSPAYQEAAKHRKAGSHYRVFIVEGV